MRGKHPGPRHGRSGSPNSQRLPIISGASSTRRAATFPSPRTSRSQWRRSLRRSTSRPSAATSLPQNVTSRRSPTFGRDGNASARAWLACHRRTSRTWRRSGFSNRFARTRPPSCSRMPHIARGALIDVRSDRRTLPRNGYDVHPRCLSNDGNRPLRRARTRHRRRRRRQPQVALRRAGLRLHLRAARTSRASGSGRYGLDGSWGSVRIRGGADSACGRRGALEYRHADGRGVSSQRGPGHDAILELGLPAIREHSVRLTTALAEGALVRGFSVPTPLDPARRTGWIGMDFPGAEHAARTLAGAARPSWIIAPGAASGSAPTSTRATRRYRPSSKHSTRCAVKGGA